MGYTTAAGTALAISAGHPATQDAAGFAALTYTTISKVDKIGTFGGTFAKVEFQPLVGGKLKLKGSVDYGTLNQTMARDPSDAGQTLLQTAANNTTNTNYSFKITRQDGSIVYCEGLVFGFPETIDGADSVNTASPTFEISNQPIYVAAP